MNILGKIVNQNKQNTSKIHTVVRVKDRYFEDILLSLVLSVATLY